MFTPFIILCSLFVLIPLALGLTSWHRGKRFVAVFYAIMALAVPLALGLGKARLGFTALAVAVLAYLVLATQARHMHKAEAVLATLHVLASGTVAGVLISDAYNWRIVGFSDDITGGVVGFIMAILASAILWHRLWRRESRSHF